jgi:hypothetical protein
MKKQKMRQERRGYFIQTTRDQAQALKRLYVRMLETTTAQGESALIRTIFSH